MRLSVIVLSLVTLSLALPGGSAHHLSTQETEGPRVLTAAQWDRGTLLGWSPPEDAADVEYVLYRGPSPDALERIAKVKGTAYYDWRGDAGQTLYYGVTILRDGEESKPTVIKADSGASCVTVGMNGSVAVTPYRCLPNLFD